MRRRDFLGAASIGWMAAGIGRKSALAQDPAAKPDTPPPPAWPADDRLNRILEAARTGGRRLPGMIGAIVRGDRIEAIAADGVRRVGSPKPIGVDDVVHLGSCTKAMTATMIGTVVDQGKLRWDSTIAEVFPAQSPKIHPDFRSVTLTQLLGHQAGLPHDVAWGFLAPGRSPTEQRRALLSGILRNPPETRPGSAYAYSNVGFALAGLMAEQATGTSWETLMRQRLFGPLGMASAGFGAPGKPGKDDQPWGHKVLGGLVMPAQADNPAAMGPAGTVHASVPDWARFAILHLKGAVGDARPLKPETLQALHTPRDGEDYVGGWQVADRSWARGRALTHNGSNTLWFSTIWIVPGLDLIFLVATNAGGEDAGTACDEVVQGMIRIASPGRRPRRP